MESVLCNSTYNSQLIKPIQTRSQSSSVISDVTSPVKLVGKAPTSLGTRLKAILTLLYVKQSRRFLRDLPTEVWTCPIIKVPIRPIYSPVLYAEPVLSRRWSTYTQTEPPTDLQLIHTWCHLPSFRMLLTSTELPNIRKILYVFNKKV